MFLRYQNPLSILHECFDQSIPEKTQHTLFRSYRPYFNLIHLWSLGRFLGIIKQGSIRTKDFSFVKLLQLTPSFNQSFLVARVNIEHQKFYGSPFLVKESILISQQRQLFVESEFSHISFLCNIECHGEGCLQRQFYRKEKKMQGCSTYGYILQLSFIKAASRYCLVS